MENKDPRRAPASPLPSPFPAEVAFVMLGGSAADSGTLLPEEALLISSASSEKRVMEFTLGRLAARRALEELGIRPAPPILRGEHREPIWPSGVVGSITHCGELAAAAIASATTFSGIGIDLESSERTPSAGIARQVAAGDEIAWLAEGSPGFNERLLMLFSAKESLYKALFPLCGTFFGFKDAHAEWRPDRCLFELTLLRDLSPSLRAGSRFESGSRMHGKLILSFTTVAHDT